MRETFRFVSWGGIGDALLATAVFRELKRRDSRCRVVVFARNVDHYAVFHGNPRIDALHGPGGLASRVAAFARWSGRRKETILNLHVHLPSLFYHQRAAIVLGEKLGLAVDDCRPELVLTPEEVARAAALLSGYPNPVAIHPVADFSQNKNWSIDKWETLIRENPQYTFVRLGLASEPPLAAAVDLRNLPLRTSFAVVKQALAFVGVDSALAHAAAALGTPAVVLFGASTPTVWGHAQNINLYHPTACSPCIEILGGDPCPYGKPCVDRISVSEVSEALRTLLN